MKNNEKFIVYAHRGASEYAPENTMSSFFMGVDMGANGIETDVRRTRDGVLVLFHDATLERVCGVDKALEDLTYSELCEIPVLHKASGKFDIVPRLEDFLHYLGTQDVMLAIELKAEGVEEDVYRLVQKYGLEKKVIVTSFNLDFLIKLKELFPEASAGYLTKVVDDELLARLKDIGIGQLCPIGVGLTKELVEKWHAKDFNVRAWGIKDIEVMKCAYDAGVDGMTVNFPDRLITYTLKKGFKNGAV